MSNNKQQTAVEWLFEQLPNKLKPHLKKELKQAKEMEKEQILKAYDAGDADRVYQPQQYYNETYGGNK
jgi:Zn-dependent oligopeptidase